MHERSNLYATCGAAANCAQSDVDGSRVKLIAGDVAAAVAITAVGAAIGVTLASWSSSPRLHVEAVRGGGAGVIEGRW